MEILKSRPNVPEEPFYRGFLAAVEDSQYVLHFLICGLILLVAIIGAIVLTSRRRQTSLKQILIEIKADILKLDRIHSTPCNNVLFIKSKVYNYTLQIVA